MSEVVQSIDEAAFQTASSQFGYQYSRLTKDTDEPLFEGSLGVQSLSCGIDLCSSDLVSLATSDHEGILDRSYTIAINFDQKRTETEFGSSGKFVLPAQGGAVVATSDAVRMANRVESGERSKCLLMRIKPEAFADDDVSTEIHAMLRETSITPFDSCARIRHLARELSQPSVGGAIGSLLTESAALELLGRTLLLSGAGKSIRSQSVGKSDYAKLLIVRDLVMAHPSRDYSLRELARAAGMSVSALKAKFPQAFGQSVFAFIAEIRLEWARDLIQNEGWSISSAAHHVGFAHHASFTAAFKRRFGVTPSRLKGQ